MESGTLMRTIYVIAEATGDHLDFGSVFFFLRNLKYDIGVHLGARFPL